MWANIKPALDDNKAVLLEHENGLRPPLDDITVKRLQSRIYEDIDDTTKAKVIKTARHDIHNILNAMEAAPKDLTLYRTILVIDDDPRPHIKAYADYIIGDIINYKNISSTSIAAGWGEDFGHSFYKLVIFVPKNTPILMLDHFDYHNEEGEVLLPPMQCKITGKQNGSGKCLGIYELDCIATIAGA